MLKDSGSFLEVGRLLAAVAFCLVVATGRMYSSAEPASPPPPAAPSLQGKVLDSSRTPIPGALITAVIDGRTLRVSTHSGVNGEFSFFIAPGAYTVRVAADGFQDAVRQVNVDSPGASLEIVLDLAPRQEMVTVSESANYLILTPTSTKTPTPLVDVPQSISVISQTLIRDQGMQSMADVVRYVPGITMAQGEGNRDAPVIRGNATTADFYVNGVRDDVQYYRDLYNVERVEAVKGANALTFGRGGGGGVINRVIKEAQYFPLHEITLQGGSFGNKRFTTDIGQNLGDKLAFRLNGVYENSNSFRRGANLERYGVAPTVSARLNDRTQIRLSYEYFSDGRTADRGIPSFAGIPVATPRSTFFGDPNRSNATTGVNIGSAVVEHQFGSLNLRNSTTIGDYDKFYQNIFPGAVNAARTLVNISGYNNSTLRRNLFNQTDLTGVFFTGRIRHTVLTGTEFGRQRSFNFRNTAYFGSATSFDAPLSSPTIDQPVLFRQAATDADNRVVTRLAAAYLQDQIELTRRLQVVAGVRYDYFNIDFRNHRTLENLGRADNMVSPRAALIFKPISPVSVYASYSVSYLPSSGDQFSSLTATTQTLRPEKFNNYEIGAKWDASRSLSFTTAVYRLDRTNTTARDPNNPALIVQTGSQRTSGYEAGVNGNLTRRWRTVGGYAYQDAFVTSATTNAFKGALVALVPRHTFSLWNHYSVTKRFSAGLGVIHQAAMYTGIDNTVKLPQFTRADLGMFYGLTENLRLQANVENLLDRTYYPTAHSNNNIMPGSPRAIRVGLTARF